ncbi:MAG TPA: transposase, partial [Acidiferrobacterales bacterium]|nr:transposase [Acidiferrobacterales bacterium]
SQLEPLANPQAFAAHLAAAAQTEWVVYAKPPFGGAEHVLHYLARYTHRVAISNNRLVDLNDGQVTFRWKDYKHGACQKTMQLPADEFIRRFLLHIPPQGFKHIRSYGFLANRCREAKLATCRRLLGSSTPAVDKHAEAQDYRERYQQLTGESLHQCPVCKAGHMVCVETFPVASPARAPPPRNV